MNLATPIDLASVSWRRDWAGPTRLFAALFALAFGIVASQVMRLAWIGQGQLRLNTAAPIVQTFARPDIVDRNGRLLATDLTFQSLFADPSLVVDPDEAAELLAAQLPELDQRRLRSKLADKKRRFVWIERGLSPAVAQRIHELGQPGLAFRAEPKRTYPQGRLAGHILGHVNVDNKGMAGVERRIDRLYGLQSGLAGDYEQPPVALTIDLGAQHSLEQELAAATQRYSASAAAGLIMDVNTGDVLAAASRPDVDPNKPIEVLEADRIDRLQVATYELGSVFKIFTVAMTLDAGIVSIDTTVNAHQPLRLSGWKLRDARHTQRPLSVRDVFVQSSNVGAARLALLAGVDRQRAFLRRIGLTDRRRSDIKALAPPQLPKRWGDVQAATIAYGHGIAVTPLQFAAAAAAMVNGGLTVTPTFLSSLVSALPASTAGQQVISAKTSATIRRLMREVVARGTGRRASVPGIEIGGKTGTAERVGRRGYLSTSVNASFVGVFPIATPKYLVLVTLIDAKSNDGRITAGTTAAPVVARIIARTGPLLGVVPH